MKRLLLFTILSLLFTVSYGQELQRSPIGDHVKRLKAKGESFLEVSPASRKASTARQAELRQEVASGTIMSLKNSKLKEMIRKEANTITLNLPDEGGQEVELELYRVNPTSPDFKITTISQGEVELENLGVHYRGIVKGKHHSLVAISIFEDEMIGLISSDEQTLVLGRLKGENPDNEHILYRDKDLTGSQDFFCATPDEGPGYTKEQLQRPASGRNPGGCTEIFVEVGNDIFASKSSDITQTANYIIGLFNEVEALYNDLDGTGNIGIDIGVSEILIWDVTDPYTGSGSSANLSSFQSTRSSFNGDLAILLNYDISGGVAAGFSGLCNGNSAASMCVAGINSGYNLVPNYSWSVFVSAHELGHLFGSRHTHACVWNGDDTAIDGCERTEGSCRKGPNPTNGGTVMSYCHLKPNIGINFANSFGLQPGNVILNNVGSADCVTSCGSTITSNIGGDPCYNGQQDAGEEGVDCGGNCPPCSSGPTCDEVPTPIEVTSITKRNATLNWNQVPAVEYKVQIREVGATSWFEFTETSTSLPLQGFRNNSVWEWKVQAVCSEVDSSGYSALCTFTVGGASTQSCGSALIEGGIFEKALTVFPNPAKDELQISINFPNKEKVQVRIFDMMGKSINKVNFEQGIATQRVNVSHFAPGMYIIRVEDEAEAYMQKVIIE